MDQPTNSAVPSAQISTPQPAGYAFPKSNQLLKDAAEIYQKHFYPLLGVSVIPVVVVLFGSILAAIMASVSDNNLFAYVIIGLLVLIYIYVYAWSYAAVVHYIMDENQTPTFSLAYKEASHDIWPLIWTGFLVTLAVTGGIILLIVPGIIFAFWFSQYSYVVITEKIKSKAALSQSKIYVKGNVAQIFYKGLYFGLISWLIAFALSLAGSLIDTVLKTNYISQLLSSIFNILWAPLGAIYLFLLFRHLKASKGHTV